MTDLTAWLEQLGLGEYAGAFAANHITAAGLADLTADDLKELGVASLGHRKRLLAAIAARGQAPPPEAADEGERRQVSILFADLCGFTALSRGLDPEDLHALVSRYTALTDAIIVRCGGRVDKHIGDAVMGLFGAPVAHGDDPLRAARAALDIHAAVVALGAELGRDLRAHAGIASGTVVAAGIGRGDRQDYTVLGDSVNLAARLVALAQPGQTVISQQVHQALGARAIAEPLGAVAAKGFERPVPAWSLRGLAAPVASRTEFIGRRAERAQFDGLLAACLETGSGQAVLVRGEAGIGKTRLVEEMTARAAARGFTTHRGLILDFGAAAAQDPVRTIVRSLLGLSDDADPAASAASGPADEMIFRHALLDAPLPAELRARYDAMDSATRSAGAHAALRRMVTEASRGSATLIVVEDLHWVGPATLAALAAMTEAIVSGPALLVMTTRREGDPIDAAWRTSCDATPLATIDLGPLRPADARLLASAFFATSPRFTEDCIDRAEGNPLFLEQLLRNAEEGAAETMPSSIQSLVLARMDRLPPRDRRALQAAAVIGQRVELAAIRHVMDDPAYDWATLIANALLRPDGQAGLFAHALVQEGVYASLLKPRRRDLHQRAALWFAGKDAALRARHLDRAEHPQAAAGYLEAATAERAAYRFDRALELAERGRAIAVDDATKHALTCLTGEVQADLGATEQSILLWRAAAASAPDDAARCRALLGLAAGLRISEGLDEALILLDAAQVIAERLDNAPDLARLHHLRGNIYFPLGRTIECRREHEASLAQARRGGVAEAEALALGGLGDAAYMQGHMASAHRAFSDCAALAQQHGFGRIEVSNRPMTAHALIYLCRLDESRAEAARAAGLAASAGQLRAELVAVLSGVFAAYEAGDIAGCDAPLAHAAGLAERLGAHRFLAQALNFEGRIAMARGDRERGLTTLRHSLDICRQYGMRFCGPMTMPPLTLATDDAAERDAVLAEGEAVLAGGAVGHNYLWFYRGAIETMLAVGDAARARRYADALEDYTAAEPLPWATLFIARGRTLADALDGAGSPLRLAAVRAEVAAAGLTPYLARIDAALSSHASDRGAYA